MFAAGYVVRPIGGVVFGVIGDKLGRKVALSLSLVCMAFPTMLIGLLPEYASIGIASTILMIAARITQGLSMGGALTGSISFTIEHSPKKHHGLVGSFSMAGACLGILAGSVVVNAVRSCMDPTQFSEWGWRIPFLLGVLIFIVGLYIKKHMAETPMFEEVKQSGNILKSPIREVCKRHWLDMILTIMVDSIGCVTFYIGAVYTISFFQNKGFDSQYIWYLTALSNLFMAIVTVLAGWLSDILGRRRLMFASAILTMLCTPFIMTSFDGDSVAMVLIAQLVLSFLAASYIGPEPALLVEFYPANVRSTALAISYNASSSIFAGATPYFVALIVHYTGKMIYASWYIEGCAIMSLVGLCYFKDRSKQITSEIQSDPKLHVVP